MKKNCCLLILALFYTCFSVAQIPTNGLVGWWPFDGNANDKSGNGNNAQVNGASLTQDRHGNYGHAYAFNGFNSFIRIPNSSLFSVQNNSSITIACWIKGDINEPNINKYIISKYSGEIGDGSALALGTGLQGNGYAWGECNNKRGKEIRGNKTINDGNWHLITYTVVLGDLATLYIDGFPDRATQFTFKEGISNNLDLFIGCGANMAQFYSGAIDDVAIWNRKLSDEEIMNLFKAKPDGDKATSNVKAKPDIDKALASAIATPDIDTNQAGNIGNVTTP